MKRSAHEKTTAIVDFIQWLIDNDWTQHNYDPPRYLNRSTGKEMARPQMVRHYKQSVEAKEVG